MNKDILKGINFGIGLLLVFSMLGIVSAVGFHYANEILTGTFIGNYIFNGNVNITNGNDLCISGGKCLSTTKTSTSLINSSEINTSQIQTRIINTCGVNESIKSINIDGTVTCEDDDSGGSPTTVMYLKHYDSQPFLAKLPANCPIGWTQADLQPEGVDWNIYNSVRTCYTTQKCSVMYLKSQDGQPFLAKIPASCPIGWSQADLQPEGAALNNYNSVRTCYICS